MKKIYQFLLLLAGAIIILSGCRSLNPSIMLKTGKNYKYAEFPPQQIVEYKIAINDKLSFQIYSNDGFKLIDVSTIGSQAGGVYNQAYNRSLGFSVEFDGTVKMPLLGHVKLVGMTVREAEMFLEEKFASFYNKPFVLLEVTNRDVTIFPGAEGTARVITLKDENTTLMEALAQAGGLARSGKAWNIKLIRGDLKDPLIYQIDLSTIEGMKKADLILQAGDIIYVEPALRVHKEVMAEVLPYLTFVTTIILFVEFFSKRTQ